LTIEKLKPLEHLWEGEAVYELQVAVALAADSKCCYTRLGKAKPKASEPSTLLSTDTDRPAGNSKYWDGDYFDFRLWMAENFYVVDKHGNLVLFVENEHQKVLLDLIESRRRAKLPCYIIIDKSRKLGFTTVVQGMILAFVNEIPYLRARTLAHEQDSTDEIYAICTTGWENIPKENRRPLKSKTPTKQIIEYAEPHNSVLRVATGGGKGKGRGGTPRFLHISEFAHWPNADRALLGLMNSIPDTWDVVVIIESTAHGKGNAFYNTWMQAQRGTSVWIPVFRSWKDDPECRLPLDPDLPFVMDEEEVRYAAEHNLDLEQMNWLRMVRDLKCGGDWNYCKQEHPCTWLESFLFTGWPWFKPEAIQGLFDQAGDPAFVGEVEWLSSDLPFVQFYEKQGGYLHVWEKPIPGKKYSGGVDTGHGIGADYSVVVIIRNDTGEVVAVYRRNQDLPAGLFGEVAAQIGYYYSTALLGVERTGIGNAALNVCEGRGRVPQIGVGYPRLYYQIVYDEKNQKQKKVHGIGTARKTKDEQMANVAKAVRDGEIKTRCVEMLLEMEGFVWDPSSNNWEQNYQDPISKRHHDDQIDALRFAWEMVYSRPLVGPFGEVEVVE
jgi:hypothetical protein